MSIDVAILILRRTRRMIGNLLYVQRYIIRNRKKLGPSWKGMDNWITDAVTLSRIELHNICLKCGMSGYLKTYERLAIKEEAKSVIYRRPDSD